MQESAYGGPENMKNIGLIILIFNFMIFIECGDASKKDTSCKPCTRVNKTPKFKAKKAETDEIKMKTDGVLEKLELHPGLDYGVLDLSTDLHIPAVMDALAQRNFITVLKSDIEPVDPFNDLHGGYFYGAEPVSSIELELETIWFRQWMSPFMPDDVKQALGIPLQQTPSS